MFGFARPVTMVSPADALPGRAAPMAGVAERHRVLDAPLSGPFPEGTQTLYVGMGCFWGAERIFWRVPGVVSTAVGYTGGYTPNPTYEETCTGRTGHTEAVRIAYDPAQVSAAELLKTFWENHDPTTPNRQGNDVGTQYRSAIFPTSDAQTSAAQRIRDAYQASLQDAGLGEITTEITPGKLFFYAEREHQQYLHKNPDGYDCHVRTGVACPIP